MLILHRESWILLILDANPDGRIIAGNQHGSPSVIDTWLHGIDNKYIRTQYFYKGIYVGYTDYDYSTGDWGERTIDDIRRLLNFPIH